MVGALKPGGQIVVLDYRHSKSRWEPKPPPAFARFYDAFLKWRADVGMDNSMADHLGAMMTELGLLDVEVTDALEVTTRGASDFERRTDLWPSVIATRGHKMVADGIIDEPERAAAAHAFAQWLVTDAQSQSLYLLAVTATRSRP